MYLRRTLIARTSLSFQTYPGISASCLYLPVNHGTIVLFQSPFPTSSYIDLFAVRYYNWGSEYHGQSCDDPSPPPGFIPMVGHSCEIGNIRLAGTLKSQNPQLLKKLLFWLSCPCLHCFWWEKNNRPPYCTIYKSPMPHSENSNVPAWQILSISCSQVENNLYFAQIICNWCNKDTIHMWDHPKAFCLHIMSQE